MSSLDWSDSSGIGMATVSWDVADWDPQERTAAVRIKKKKKI